MHKLCERTRTERVRETHANTPTHKHLQCKLICLLPKRHETRTEWHHRNTQIRWQMISSHGKDLSGLHNEDITGSRKPYAACVIRMSRANFRRCRRLNTPPFPKAQMSHVLRSQVAHVNKEHGLKSPVATPLQTGGLRSWKPELVLPAKCAAPKI